MKKFIKSRIDQSEITNHTSLAPNLTCKAPIIKSEVQPPLPLEPPPDTLANLNIQVKQEVKGDDDIKCNNSAEIKPDTSKITKVSQETKEKSKTNIICRDYIRGTCRRQGNCRYVHKCDISQLAGVYTFCHMYQNSVCTLANCKYVHATIFEEQQFYRTGILPARALRFRNILQALLAPPPPPPPKQEKKKYKVEHSQSQSLLTTKRSKTENSEFNINKKRKITDLPIIKNPAQNNYKYECTLCNQIDKYNDDPNVHFVKLIKLELDFVDPCLRTDVYIEILKIIQRSKYRHANMPPDYAEINEKVTYKY